MSNETNNNNNVRNNSIGEIEFTIGEIEVKGITLKNLKMSAHADITDENIRISTDGAVGVLKAILNFVDSKLDKMIEHRMEMEKIRSERSEKESAASIEEKKARSSKYNAESKYWDAKRDAILKEYPATADKDNN